MPGDVLQWDGGGGENTAQQRGTAPRCSTARSSTHASQLSDTRPATRQPVSSLITASRSPLHRHNILSIPSDFDPDQTSPNVSCFFHTHCHDPYRIIWMIFCKMRKQSIFVSSVTSSDRPENCHVVKCCNVFYISDNPYQVVDHENSCIESERETVNRCDWNTEPKPQDCL